MTCRSDDDQEETESRILPKLNHGISFLSRDCFRPKATQQIPDDITTWNRLIL